MSKKKKKSHKCESCGWELPTWYDCPTCDLCYNDPPKRKPSKESK